MAKALGYVGGGNADAVAALIKLLDDQEEDVRRSAADALGWVAGGNNAAVAKIIKLVDDRNEYVRRRAASALGVGVSDRVAFEQLYQLMLEKSEYQNDGAYSTLAAMVVAGRPADSLCAKLAPEGVSE